VSTPEQRNPDDGGMVSPWRGTTPELVIAGVAVAVAAVAAYATAGWAGLTVVAVATAAGAMVLLRALLPQLTPDAAKKAQEKALARTLTGYSHRRFVVHTAMTSRNYYDIELRPVLEHLLAARHGDCCAVTPATRACGSGSTRPPGRRIRPGTARIGVASPGTP
jgi:hypothetical protein